MWLWNWTTDGLGGYFVIWVPVSCATSWKTGRKNFNRLDGRCSPCKLPYRMEVMSLENDRYPQFWPPSETMDLAAPFSLHSFTLKRKCNLWCFLLHRTLRESLMLCGSWYSEAEITNDNWYWHCEFKTSVKSLACWTVIKSPSWGWMSTRSNNEDIETHEVEIHLVIRSANMFQVVVLSRNSCAGSDIVCFHCWRSREANAHRRRPMQQAWNSKGEEK